MDNLSKITRREFLKSVAAASLAGAGLAGCASVSVPPFPASAQNQEELVQKLLIGTWGGYIKDTSWARMRDNNRERKLIIYGVRKEQNGWTVDARLNWQPLEYIKLNIYGDTVTLEIMDRRGGFYTLQLYQNNHLLGKMSYGRGAWILLGPHEVILEKISR